MNETIVRGPVQWKVKYEGIRGGAIELHVVKNRVSFVKIIRLKKSEDFDTSLKICREKVSRILHIKNHKNPDLFRLANYCIDATSVEEMTTCNKINTFENKRYSMEIRLTQLSGADLDEALKVQYISQEEKHFVHNAIESFEEYPNYVHWIQIKEKSTDTWVNCGMITFGVDEDEFPGFWIYRLMIHPNFRKKKITTEAFKLAISKAPPNTPIYSSMIIGNVSVERIFKNIGFVKIETSPDWDDELVYKFEGDRNALSNLR